MSARAAADRLLSWQPGTQASSLIIRYHPSGGFDFLPSAAAPLPPGVGSYRDSTQLTDVTYCYILMTYLGDVTSPDVRGLSDLLCIFPGTSTGPVPPGQFRIRLNETGTATLNWTPPGGQIGYTLVRTRFDNVLPVPIPILGNLTSYAEEIGALPTCYQLVALGAQAPLGGTDVLCAVPRVASFAG